MPKKMAFGLAVRQYCKTIDQIPDRVKRTEEIVRKAYECDFYKKIYIVIPVNYDCGHTAAAIKKMLGEQELFSRYGCDVEVIEVIGHHSRGALNQAVLKAQYDEVTHLTFLSGKAVGNLNGHVLHQTRVQFLMHSVKAVALAVNSEDGLIEVNEKKFTHREWIIEGFAQNTFLTWEVEALIDAGMFDESREAGCEEIVPLWNISQKFGSCLVVIDPEYKAMKTIDQERHQEVLTKKWETTQRELAACGTTYRKFISSVLIQVLFQVL